MYLSRKILVVTYVQFTHFGFSRKGIWKTERSIIENYLISTFLIIRVLHGDTYDDLFCQKTPLIFYIALILTYYNNFFKFSHFHNQISKVRSGTLIVVNIDYEGTVL